MTGDLKPNLSHSLFYYESIENLSAATKLSIPILFWLDSISIYVVNIVNAIRNNITDKTASTRP